MDLKEVKTFQAILREGTFSKAAQKLNYAQSTITSHIQKLENEIGFKLFERGWEAKLTESGEIFAKEIHSLIKHWDFVLEQSKAIEKEEVGTINIGAIETASTVLPSTISQFREIKPNVTCNITVGNTDTLINLLDSGMIDFAIGGKPYKENGYSFIHLYEEEISVIFSKKYYQNPITIQSLHDITEYPVFIGGENCLYYTKFEEELSHLDSKPFYYTVSQILSIPLYIHNFPSIGVVLSSSKLSDNIVKVPLELKNPFIPIGIIQKKDNKYLSNIKKLFLDLIRDSFDRE